MKEKTKQWIFVIAFFAILTVPSLVWPFLQESLAGDNAENRNLAEKPVFSLEEIREYPAKYEAYYNDRLPFRSHLIHSYSRLGYELFGDVAGADAVVGKEGWLFYRSQTDGDPMGDYKGRTLFYQNELEAIARNLLEARDLLAEDGVEFVLMIAPNKECIYSEYMPDHYGEPAQESAVTQLVTYLQENTDLRVVYVYDALMAVKEQLPQIPLYYKMDTHWNNVGGYAGASQLLAELGITMPPVTELTVEIGEAPTTYTDLVNQLSLQKVLGGEPEYLIQGWEQNGMVQDEWDFFGQYRFHSEAADDRHLVVIRDSFCSAMARVLATQLAQSTMIHNSAYSYEVLQQAAPDVVVYQIVERFLPDLIYWRLGK